jgi:tetratricopeptide (TPR) repeat protein
MAKKIKQLKNPQPEKTNSWLLNKVNSNKHFLKKSIYKASKWVGFIGVFLFLLIVIGSLFLPQSETQKIKLKLLADPFNFDYHLSLAEKFLENHQFKEAEKTLLLAQQIADNRLLEGNFKKESLKEEKLLSLEKLWQIKNLADPKDIQKLIISWEKIIASKPDYRDGYLQLAFLNHKIFQKEKALLYVNKALEIDPNFEVSRRLKEIIIQP